MQSSYLRLQPTSRRSRSDTHSNNLANDSPGNKSRLLHGFASSSISLSVLWIGLAGEAEA